MKFFAALAFSVFAVAASAADRPPPEHPPEYYYPEVQRLIYAAQFAFGPSGFRHETSEGERAFTAVVNKKDAVRCMLQVFQYGTGEGRCYAMVALREYSPELFRDVLTSFRDDHPDTITVVEGSIISHVPAMKVADSINRGFYRKYFEQHEGEKR